MTTTTTRITTKKRQNGKSNITILDESNARWDTYLYMMGKYKPTCFRPAVPFSDAADTRLYTLLVLHAHQFRHLKKSERGLVGQDVEGTIIAQKKKRKRRRAT